MRGRYLLKKKPWCWGQSLFVTDWDGVCMSFCRAFTICSLCFLNSLSLTGKEFTNSKFGDVRNMCDSPGLRDTGAMWLSLWRSRIANLSRGEGSQKGFRGQGSEQGHLLQCSSYAGACFSRLLKAICCFSFILYSGNFPQLICTVQVLCLFTI